MSNEKMRDGLVRRGASWSYVIRVRDPETGRSRPQVLVSRYEPIDGGPTWEAAGDRAPPESLGAVLCAVCLALLRSWLYETQETS